MNSKTKRRMEGSMSDLYIGGAPVLPTTTFWAGSVHDEIHGKVFYPAVIQTVHKDISLEVYPPRCKPEDEEGLIRKLSSYPPFDNLPTYGDLLKSLREYRQEERSRYDNISKKITNIDDKYTKIMSVVQQSTSPEELTQKLNAALEDVLEERDRLRNSMKFILEEIKRLEEEERPFPGCYLTVRSIHGNISLRVYDPDAIVDIVKLVHGKLSVTPSDYKPRSAKRRIGIETIHGDVNINYEPVYTPVIPKSAPNNISAHN